MKDGKIFVKMLQECVDALNGGRFPRLKSTWDYIVQEENQKLLTEIILEYQSKLFDGKEDSTKEDYIDLFFQKSYGLDDPAQIRFYERQLRTEFSKIKKEFKTFRIQQQKRELETKWNQISHIFDKQARENYTNANLDDIETGIMKTLEDDLKLTSLDTQTSIV